MNSIVFSDAANVLDFRMMCGCEDGR